MLYYFSGTGNSKFVCEELSKLLGEKTCPITAPRTTEDSSIGIVFPVYVWGMPHMVKCFVEKELGRLILSSPDVYIYIVMTCGDDMGYTDRLFERSLRSIGRSLSAAFSVLMPNTYISLPGFDIDSDELSNRKINATLKLLPHIASLVHSRANVTKVTRGGVAWIKTYLLHPLFTKYMMDDNKFHVADSCTGCRKCARACNVANIIFPSRSSEGAGYRPMWQHHCEGCLACYHTCPQHAIEYGKFTRGKGQKKILLQQEL